MITSCSKIAKQSATISDYKIRLHQATKFAKSNNFENLMHQVNPLTYHFILCQVRNQKQQPKARRYSIEEKLLALTVLKASGKGYRLLSKIFCLPSKKTLTLLLNKIPFESGINEVIFESLEQNVRKMKEIDRMAILVFDEMSIDSVVQYSPKKDVIVGLHDEGTNYRKPQLADHVNVFLLKGVFRQWKQPIVFTFSNGPCKNVAIKRLLVEIIKKCHSIGLNIIATVCDQGSSNQTAIKNLLQETKAKCLKENIENDYFGFLVDNHEIIPLYDTPHLFKGLRNNLLSKDLHLTLNNKKCTAKWKHIEQFYLLDIEDEDRICHKLTDQHVIRGKINKMKVRCCTQVFSHQVGALMKKIISWSKYIVVFYG